MRGLSTVGCSVSDGALWLAWVCSVRRRPAWGWCGPGVGGWECQMFLAWWVYELGGGRGGAGWGGGGGGGWGGGMVRGSGQGGGRGWWGAGPGRGVAG